VVAQWLLGDGAMLSVYINRRRAAQVGRLAAILNRA
jgi:hypothetical protein